MRRKIRKAADLLKTHSEAEGTSTAQLPIRLLGSTTRVYSMSFRTVDREGSPMAGSNLSSTPAYTCFGQTDLWVSRICQGTAFRKNRRDAYDAGTQRVLARCIDLGINFFDSSNAYRWGRSRGGSGKSHQGPTLRTGDLYEGPSRSQAQRGGARQVSAVYPRICSTGDRSALVDRELECDMFPLLRPSGLALLPYSPMDEGRLVWPNAGQDPATLSLLAEVDHFGRGLGATRPQVLLAGVLSHPEVTCVLTGAEGSEQVDENYRALDFARPDEAISQLNAVSHFVIDQARARSD